jgi:hypothetical protein
VFKVENEVIALEYTILFKKKRPPPGGNGLSEQ